MTDLQPKGVVNLRKPDTQAIRRVWSRSQDCRFIRQASNAHLYELLRNRSVFLVSSCSYPSVARSINLSAKRYWHRWSTQRVSQFLSSDMHDSRMRYRTMLKVHKMRSKSDRNSAESNARNHDRNGEKQLQCEKNDEQVCKSSQLRAPEDCKADSNQCA